MSTLSWISRRFFSLEIHVVFSSALRRQVFENQGKSENRIFVILKNVKLLRSTILSRNPQNTVLIPLVDHIFVIRAVRKIVWHGVPYRLNMELYLQSLLAPCAQLYSLIVSDPATSLPLHLGSHTRALMVNQDRRQFFVTPWVTVCALWYLNYVEFGLPVLYLYIRCVQGPHSNKNY